MTAAAALGLLGAHPPGPTRRRCGIAPPAWKSNGTSAAGSRPPPSGPGWPARCTTSSATTCPSSSPSPTAAPYAADSAPERGKEALQLIGDTGRRPWRTAPRARRAARGRTDGARTCARSPASPTSTRCATAYRAAGPQVVYRTAGELDALDLGVQLAVYRIVAGSPDQHPQTRRSPDPGAPGPRSRRLPSWSDHASGDSPARPATAAAARPTGAAPRPTDRHGLVGMRERAALYGGSRQRRPRAGGGWTRRGRLDLTPRRDRATGDHRAHRGRPAPAALGFRHAAGAPARRPEVVGEAAHGAEAVRQAAELRPDVVLMDVRMPGMDGIEATRPIVAAGGRSRVLVLTTFDLDEYVHAALRAGASGFLLKDARPEELLAGIRAVAAGDAVIAPALTRRLLDEFAQHLGPAQPDASAADDPRLDTLTEREREILDRHRPRLDQRRDRERLVLSRVHREDARRPGTCQDRRPRPGPGRDLRLRPGPDPPEHPDLTRNLSLRRRPASRMETQLAWPRTWRPAWPRARVRARPRPWPRGPTRSRQRNPLPTVMI